MSNYADSSRYSQVAQEAQLAHYGLPTGGVPRVQTSRPSEYKGTIPQRKPVQTGTARNQEGPYPSMTPTPTRKPVGGRRTMSSSSTRPQSPPFAKSGDHAGKYKPLPPVPRAPSAFSSTPSAPPMPLPTRPLAPKASTSTTSVSDQPQRPSSSSGWSFRGRKRTGSNASNASNATGTSTPNKQRTRNGSFSSITETAKKTGKWFSGRVEIIAMGPKQREALFATPKPQDLEAKRQRGEMDRPVHQKQEITRRTSGLDNPGQTVGVAGYDAYKEHEASRRRRVAGYQKQHARDCEEAARYGRRRPSTPQAAKLSPPQRRDSFTPSMNEAAETRFAGVDIEANRPRPGKVDIYTAYLSKAVDPFKRKDSDASMWLSDTAPPGSMDYCSKCGKAPQKSLQDKLCEDCYRGRYFGK